MGLIVLGCIVAACFCIEPIAQMSGCGRTSDVVDSEASQAAKFPEGEVQSAEESGWVSRDDRSDSHKRSDSIRDVKKRGHRNSKSAKSGSKSRKRSKKSSDKRSAPPSRRSLRDEKL